MNDRASVRGVIRLEPSFAADRRLALRRKMWQAVPSTTNMIRITGPQNTAAVEAELRELALSPDDSLQLPVHPKDWWLGGELGLIQLAITWARQSSNSALVTHVAHDEDPETQLQAMARRLFGFVAILMAPEVIDRDKSRSLRREAYDYCRQVVDMMFQPVSRFALGAKVFLVSVDHSTRWDTVAVYAGRGRG